MRICIYGAGAMGSSMGARLAAAGISCDLVTRNKQQVEALNKAGLSAMLPEEMQGAYDVIFLATRQHDNAAIARFLLPYLKEDGALVSVQNGLPEAGLAEVFGKDRVYGCALGWGATCSSYGVAQVTSEDKRLQLALGAYGKGEKLDALVSFLGQAFEVRAGDLAEIRYGKLVINASFSTLSAISGLTFGTLARKYRREVLLLARETAAVASAAGCRQLMQNGHDLMKFFTGKGAKFLLPIAMRKHKRIRSGMLKDLEAGRRCDVDFVAGSVIAAGKKLGVATPYLSRAVQLVHDIENGLAELAPETLLFLGDAE